MREYLELFHIETRIVRIYLAGGIQQGLRFIV
jgi:hypothetical protein